MKSLRVLNNCWNLKVVVLEEALKSHLTDVPFFHLDLTTKKQLPKQTKTRLQKKKNHVIVTVRLPI
jgi:hypothetical protein